MMALMSRRRVFAFALAFVGCGTRTNLDDDPQRLMLDATADSADTPVVDSSPRMDASPEFCVTPCGMGHTTDIPGKIWTNCTNWFHCPNEPWAHFCNDLSYSVSCSCITHTCECVHNGAAYKTIPIEGCACGMFSLTDPWGQPNRVYVSPDIIRACGLGPP
jgi:hypothetical protein